MLHIDKQFEDSIIKELKNDNLAIFGGAGLSRSSVYFDWATLLSGMASKLGVTIDKGTDKKIKEWIDDQLQKRSCLIV